MKMREIARQFVEAETIFIENLGSGNINDTYLVTADGMKFVLQRINGQVFPEPENVARNTAFVSEYLRARYEEGSDFCLPEIIAAKDKRRWYRDEAGSIWRAQSYIGRTRVFDTIDQPEYARQAGRCLGKFHHLLADLDPQSLITVIPGFHNTPAYLKKYDEAVTSHSLVESKPSRFCSDFIKRMRGRASFWDEAVKSGFITPKIVHGDPKVSNFLFQKKKGTAIALIDLDTVGPGLTLQDIGDGIRSCCCPSKEGDEIFAGRCDTELLHAFINGYLEMAELSDFEQRHVFDALLLITFELGLRFFTDYLMGNVYFKVNDDQENLRRATQQLSLAEDILVNKRKLTDIIINIFR